jgi:hypothetical protein
MLIGVGLAPRLGAPVFLRGAVVSVAGGLMLGELIVTGLLVWGDRSRSRSMTRCVAVVGSKVPGVGWFHDGSAAGQVKRGFGNNGVVAAIVVTLPYLSRPVALPVLAALAVKGAARNPAWPATWWMRSRSGVLTAQSMSWPTRSMAAVRSLDSAAI